MPITMTEDPTSLEDGGRWDPQPNETFEDWLEADETIPGKIVKPQEDKMAVAAELIKKKVKGLFGRFGRKDKENDGSAGTAVTPAAEEPSAPPEDDMINTYENQEQEEWWNQQQQEGWDQQEWPEQDAYAYEEEPPPVKELRGDELNEPRWATQSGFVRCACVMGVPIGNRAYEPVAVSESSPDRLHQKPVWGLG